MTICDLCGGKIGLFGTVYNIDGLRFCKNCAPIWPAEHKKNVIQHLFDAGEPTELLALYPVKTRAPDSPRRKVMLLGRLSFTDKGICFAQVARSSTMTFGEIGLMLWFGPLAGGLAVAGGRTPEALKDVSRSDGEKEVFAGGNDLSGVLERSPRLVFINAREITDIRCSALTGLRVFVGKKYRLFTLGRGAGSYKRLRSAMKEYLAAIRM